jgi:hypothetical protein
MAAVVLADLAVEMAAKAAVFDQPLPRKARLDQDPPLPAVLEALTHLWQQREDAQDDVPEVREAGRLHDLRNSVQHAGLAPSSDQVVESRLRSRRFLSWVAIAWFGVPLESVSRARLIENAAVRNLVEEAEGAANADDYSTAAERLAVAFEMARREFRAEMREGRYVLQVTAADVGAAVSEVRRGGGDTVGLGYRKFDDVLRWLAQELARLTDQVEALSLGARASDYAWFKKNFPAVQGVMRKGEVALSAYPPREPIAPAVYLRGLDFVTTTALHWQEFPAADPKGE